jgi:single-strand DNA-binding protein
VIGINKVILIGRLVRDVELRYTPSGAAVARFTLAVDRRKVKDRDKETDFIDVVAWQKLAENCANYIGKGRLVAIDGRLQIRSYEGNDGIKRKAAEVVAENVQFLDKGGSNSNSQQQHGDAYEGPGSGGSEISFDEDSIPF